jgi:hypothetical protein
LSKTLKFALIMGVVAAVLAGIWVFFSGDTCLAPRMADYFAGRSTAGPPDNPLRAVVCETAPMSGEVSRLVLHVLVFGLGFFIGRRAPAQPWAAAALAAISVSVVMQLLLYVSVALAIGAGLAGNYFEWQNLAVGLLYTLTLVGATMVVGVLLAWIPRRRAGMRGAA